MKVLLVAAVIWCSFVAAKEGNDNNDVKEWKPVSSECYRFEQSLKEGPAQCFRVRLFVIPELCEYTCDKNKIIPKNCTTTNPFDVFTYIICAELKCVLADKDATTGSQETDSEERNKKDKSEKKRQYDISDEDYSDIFDENSSKEHENRQYIGIDIPKPCGGEKDVLK